MTAYAAGSFSVPGSTGNHSVNVGFEPQVVLFFGSNQEDEDTVVVGAEASVMRGTMVMDDVTDTIQSWCSSLIPHNASRWEQKPIVSCKDGNANTDYQADAVSMDTNGFTVDFTVLPAGDRTVHWVAIGGMDNCTAGIHTGGANYDIGWAPLSGLHLGGLDDTILDALGSNAEAATWGNMLTWGGKTFGQPTDDISDDESVWITAIDTPFTNQCYIDQGNSTATTSYVGLCGHFLGPFLVPTAHIQQMSDADTVYRAVGGDNQGHFTELDAHSDVGGVAPETDVDDVETITAANPEIKRPALILFLGVCGRPLGAAQPNENAVTFGFWTRGHQACFAVNGVDDSFFQSSQYGFCDKVEAGGAHAGEVSRNGLSLDLTTKVSGVSPASMEWHLFGGLAPGWVPQIYRRIPV